MTKREKYIIGFVALSIAYGGYNFFVIPGGMANQLVAEEMQIKPLETILQNVDERLSETEYTELEQYNIRQMQTIWETDPFYNRESPFHSTVIDASNHERKNPDFTYTGYVMIGESKLAIINGHEYQAGEELKSGKYLITEIYPNKVVMNANFESIAANEANDVPERVVIELLE